MSDMREIDKSDPFDAMLELVAMLNPSCGDSLCHTPDPTICRCSYMLTMAMQALDKAGFAIVPKEPTREMWAAGGDACVTLGNVHHDRVTGDVWTAMVAAGAVKP